MTTQTIRKTLAGSTLTAGTAAIGAAIPSHSPTQGVAGLALIIVGVTAWVLTVIDHAIRDTARERKRLQDLIDEEFTEKAKYQALRGIIEGERERMCHEMAKLEHDTAERLAAEIERLRTIAEAEREELMAELEDREAAIKTEGWQRGFDHGVRGITLDEALHSGDDATVFQLPVSAIGSGGTSASRGAYLPS